MHAALCLAALACAGAVAACGGTTIDAGKAERFIDGVVVGQIGVPVEVGCPSGLEASEGETFECAVTAKDGTRGNVTVTMTDDEGGVDVDARFLATGELEETIAGGLAERYGGSYEVDCPDLIPSRRGSVSECDASSADGEREAVRLEQTSDDGDFEYGLQ
jgi:hypothetical protein